MKETIVVAILTFLLTIAVAVGMNPPRPCPKCHAPTISMRYYPKTHMTYRLCVFQHGTIDY